MDGKKLTRLFLDALDELNVSSQYATQRKAYEMLDWAAQIFARELKILHSSVTVTTVASQQSYDLPPDFIELWIQNRKGRFLGKFNDGANDSWPVLTAYEKIYKSNYTDDKDIPDRFAIIDKQAKENVITSTASAAGAASSGQCTLTDTTKNFLIANKVYPRDIIHNITDESDGYVLSVTDATKLVVALFDGTNNDITNADAYRIQPASEFTLYLDAPSKTAGYTLELPYVCMPSPVFSELGWWRFNPRSSRAIAWGAAAMLKVPEREFTEASHIGGLFADEISRVRREIAQSALLNSSRYRSVR